MNERFYSKCCIYNVFFIINAPKRFSSYSSPDSNSDAKFAFSVNVCTLALKNSVMEDKIILSGLTLAQIQSKAQYILETEVKPRSELFRIRKREGRLSKEVMDLIKQQNA